MINLIRLGYIGLPMVLIMGDQRIKSIRGRPAMKS